MAKTAAPFHFDAKSAQDWLKRLRPPEPGLDALQRRPRRIFIEVAIPKGVLRHA